MSTVYHNALSIMGQSTETTEYSSAAPGRLSSLFLEAGNSLLGADLETENKVKSRVMYRHRGSFYLSIIFISYNAKRK